MAETVVTSPDGQKIKVTHPEGATQEQIFRYAREQMAQNVNPTMDVARSAISGVQEGLRDVTTRLPEGVGQLGDLAGRGIMALSGDPRTYEEARMDRAQLFAGDATTPEELPLFARAAYETSQAYRGMEDLIDRALTNMGIKYDPQTTGGRYAGAVSRFATGFALPAATVSKLSPLREGLVGAATGITSEAGGDIADALGYDRETGQLIGSLVTPLGAATLGSRFRRPATNAASDIVRALPVEEATAAMQAQRAAQEMGTALFPAEAVPGLRQLEGDTVAMGGDPAATIGGAYNQRAAGSEDIASGVIPAAPSPGRAALTQQVSERARQIGQRAVDERTAATRPGYIASADRPVDLPAMDAILQGAAQDALRNGDTTLKGRALQSLVDAFTDSQGNPFTTIDQWHNRYQELRNALSVDASIGNQLIPNLDKGVAAVVEPYLAQIKEALRSDPDFRQADDIYQRMSPEVKAIFGDSELPDLASMEAINSMMKLESWPQVRQLMLGENLSPSDLRDVLVRVNEEDALLAQMDPNHQPILPQVARELMRSELVRASKVRAGAPEANAMRSLWNAFSDDDVRSRMFAVLRSSAEAQGLQPHQVTEYLNGVEEAFSLFRKMLPSPNEGSPTAGRGLRGEEMAQAQTGLGGAVQTATGIDIARPLGTLDNLFDWSRRIRLSNYRDLADVLADPNGIQILMELPRARGDAARQATLLEALMALQVGAQDRQ